jgi:hypothetical protein
MWHPCGSVSEVSAAHGVVDARGNIVERRGVDEQFDTDACFIEPSAPNVQTLAPKSVGKRLSV